MNIDTLLSKKISEEVALQLSNKSQADELPAERAWVGGEPPHIGWWNSTASGPHGRCNQRNNMWRWWDGLHWSEAVFDWNSEEEMIAVSKTPDFNVWDILWCDYWPENARVARIDPGPCVAQLEYERQSDPKSRPWKDLQYGVRVAWVQHVKLAAKGERAMGPAFRHKDPVVIYVNQYPGRMGKYVYSTEEEARRGAEGHVTRIAVKFVEDQT